MKCTRNDLINLAKIHPTYTDINSEFIKIFPDITIISNIKIQCSSSTNHFVVLI